MSEQTTTPVDPAVIEAGKVQYLLCQPCHGSDGQGIDMVGPALAGSEWVLGPAENLIRIQLRGLEGPITVNGNGYTFMVPMPAQPFQTDEQIAQVLTYIRNSWGNAAPAVGEEEVAALRSEVGKPMLTQADLIPPQPPDGGGDASAVPPAPPSAPLPADPGFGLPAWAWVLALVWIGLCLWPVLRRGA